MNLNTSMWLMNVYDVTSIGGDANAGPGINSTGTWPLPPLPAPSAAPNWGVLALSGIILATVMGNVLVCLAVCWESRLQNMTNYFLMSLAIADLLVALLIMPLSMVVELYGHFPFHANVCVVWLTMDVFMCTASIWHMCTMSMDRFFTLKYPMKYGRNKTTTMVALKIAFVWIVSACISSPVLIIGFINHSSVLPDKICLISDQNFLLYGSILAFYIPLLIMVITYVLTIRILCKNQKLMKKISREHTQLGRLHKTTQNGNTSNVIYRKRSFLSPEISYNKCYSAAPTFEASGIGSISREASILEVSSHMSASQPNNLDSLVIALKNDNKNNNYECTGGALVLNEKEDIETPQNHLSVADSECLKNEDQYTDMDSCAHIRRNSMLSSLSVSQPNLIVDNGGVSNNPGRLSIRRSHSCSQDDENDKQTKSKYSSNSNSNVNLIYGTNLNKTQRHSNQSSSRKINVGDGLLSPTSACECNNTSAIWNVQSQPNLLLGPSRSFPLENYHGKTRFHRPKDQIRQSSKGKNKTSRSKKNHHKQQPFHLLYGYASSQPHLPSMNNNKGGGYLSPAGSPLSAFQFPSTKSINSILDLESVKNYDCISACSSVNSTQSIWSDFEQPVMLQKFTKIEAEMDLCIMENSPPKETDNSLKFFIKSNHPSLSQSNSNHSNVTNYSPAFDDDGISNNHNVIPPVCVSSPTPNLSLEHSPSKSPAEPACLSRQTLEEGRHTRVVNHICDSSQDVYKLSSDNPHPLNNYTTQDSSHNLNLSGSDDDDDDGENGGVSDSLTQKSQYESFKFTVEHSKSIPNSIDTFATCSCNASMDIDTNVMDTTMTTTSDNASSQSVYWNNSNAQISPPILNHGASSSSSVFGPYLSVYNRKHIKSASNGDIQDVKYQLPNSHSNSTSSSKHRKQQHNSDEDKDSNDSSTEENAIMMTSDDCLSDTVSQTTQTTYAATVNSHVSPSRLRNPNTIINNNNNTSSGNKYTSFLLRKFNLKTKESQTVATSIELRMHNGYGIREGSLTSMQFHSKGVSMSKRTANNERKASKVLGIIFAVFVVLWTPFFIVNILAGLCLSCTIGLTAPIMTAITWLGYMSSLANPIIYTMFNTSFRKAFLKILTCKYKFCNASHNRKKANKYTYKYSCYKPSIIPRNNLHNTTRTSYTTRS